MTEQERRDRNPKPEFLKFNVDDLVEVKPSDMEAQRPYILRGTNLALTCNFVQSIPTSERLCYSFVLPRVATYMVIPADAEGNLLNTDGTKITVYRFDGPDA